MAPNPMRLSADDVIDIDVPPHLRGYELEGGDVLPGLSVPLAEVFARVPPEAGD